MPKHGMRHAHELIYTKSTNSISLLDLLTTYYMYDILLIDLSERTFQTEGSRYLACNDRYAFSNRKT